MATKIVWIDKKVLELKGMAGLWGFEPQFEAPEASVISKLHYRPVVIGIPKDRFAPLVGGEDRDRAHFFLNSVYPHLPQEVLSLCSAMNTPGPHLGQDFFMRSSLSPLVW